MHVTTKSLALGLVAALGLVGGDAHAMGLNDLVRAISHQTELEEADARRVLEAFLATTTSALKRGDRVVITGFGSFSIARRMAPGSCTVAAYPEFHFDPASKGCDSPECHACTVYDADLAEGMAVATRLDPRLTAVALDIIKREITGELFVSNQIVNLAGFGSFRVVLEAEVTRGSSSTPTAKEMKVEARKVVRFSPGEELSLSVR